MADGVTIDNDGDGIPDWWMIQYFGHPTGQASDQSFAWSDPAGDGLSNLQKYLLGRNPLVWDNLHFTGCQYLADGRLRLSVFGQVGHNYTLLASTNLANWVPVLSFACTNGAMDVFDPDATNFQCAVLPAGASHCGLRTEARVGVRAAAEQQRIGLGVCSRCPDWSIALMPPAIC